ncbi:MAG: type II/IV secretion system protein [Magnetococcales bacterium]|nr:type II/IV secretion system protein [Magnetococcales bacterium]
MPEAVVFLVDEKKFIRKLIKTFVTHPARFPQWFIEELVKVWWFRRGTNDDVADLVLAGTSAGFPGIAPWRLNYLKLVRTFRSNFLRSGEGPPGTSAESTLFYCVHQCIREARSRDVLERREGEGSFSVDEAMDLLCSVLTEVTGVVLVYFRDGQRELSLRANKTFPLWLNEAESRLRGAVLFDHDGAAPVLEYGTCDPTNADNHLWIERHSGRPARPVFVHPDAFYRFMRYNDPGGKGGLESQGHGAAPTASFVVMDPMKLARPPELRGSVSGRRAMAASDGRRGLGESAMRQLNNVLFRALAAGASDLHLESGPGGLEVRYRIHGILESQPVISSKEQPLVLSAFKLLSGMDVARKRAFQDGHRVLSAPDLDRIKVDARFSVVPTIHGEKMVIRILDRKEMVRDLSTLGMKPQDQRALELAIRGSKGLILLSGPTGSGKTSTLYSCLNAIVNGTQHIITVEDPVEVEFEGVQQIQVNPRQGVTFAGGLRAILRQDPDVIMVGEIRDRQTAKMVVQASLTGHLVLSTIHANTARDIPARLQSLGVSEFESDQVLTLAISQRLIRKLCICAVPTDDSALRSIIVGLTIEDELNRAVEKYRLLKNQTSSEPNFKMVKPEYKGKKRGCGETGCHGGYKGRQALFDVYDPRSKETNMMRGEESDGVDPLLRDAMRMVVNGETSLEEVIRVFGATPKTDLYS